MKIITLIAAISVVAIGCSPSTTTETTPTDTPAANPDPRPAANQPQGAELGTEASADHYMVTLKTEPTAPTQGEVKFLADISHHGEPASGAKVTVKLSMPGHGMDGPTVEMKHVGNGKFEGVGNLSMGGDWQAQVDIDENGHVGSTKFKFQAMQK